jgi:hypothetical protein
MASSDKCAVADLNFSSSFLEADIGMNDRIFAYG